MNGLKNQDKDIFALIHTAHTYITFQIRIKMQQSICYSFLHFL